MSFSSEEAETKTTRSRAERRMVWLVDDDRSLVALMAELLKLHSDIRVQRQFESAESMLQVFLAGGDRPDVILMDVQMPGMSGLDALKELSRLAPETAVVIMTTFYNKDYKTRAIDSGASSFLLKSSGPERFIQAVLSAVPLRDQTSLHGRKEPAAEDAVSSFAFAREWLSRSIEELGRFGRYKPVGREVYANSIRSVCE